MADTSTIVGIVLGFLLLFMGILIVEGGNVLFFLNLPSALIVIGGATCALLINFSFRDLRNVGKVLKFGFTLPRDSAPELIAAFRRYADVARRDGILALENVTGGIRDPFLVRGIQLAVDGTDPEVIQSMMRTELDYIHYRHDRGIRVIRKYATYAPAFGMMGTLIGLVIMLQNLGAPETIGPAMAVAIVTTFYGLVSANLVAAPLAAKLTLRNDEELIMKEMMVRGVMSIQSGDNPRIVEQKLKIFIAPRLREAPALR